MDAAILGQRIRDARERLGLSQEDLAIAVSKDQRAISDYEHGKRRLAATELPTFARALDVSLLYFYEGEVKPRDLDQVILDEFQQLPTLAAKEYAIAFVRLFSEAIKAVPR